MMTLLSEVRDYIRCRFAIHLLNYLTSPNKEATFLSSSVYTGAVSYSLPEVTKVQLLLRS